MRDWGEGTQDGVMFEGAAVRITKDLLLRGQSFGGH